MFKKSLYDCENGSFCGLKSPVISSLKDIQAAVEMVLSLKKEKIRGVPVDVGVEPGYAIRNYQFTSHVKSGWDTVTTLAELFEHSCKRYSKRRLLGTRKLISGEVEVSDGKSFEKLHLGDYEWFSYGQVFEAACNFACGLTQLGHQKGECAAIFAETCKEWYIAMQGCFRHNITVVTIYTSLGEEALCHSFNETEVTTVICGYKELKKITNISGQLHTVKHIICMDDGLQTDASLASGSSSSWTITRLKELIDFSVANGLFRLTLQTIGSEPLLSI